MLLQVRSFSAGFRSLANAVATLPFVAFYRLSPPVIMVLLLHRCVAAGMDYLLKRVGMSKRKTKHLTFALRREYLLQCDSELG